MMDGSLQQAVWARTWLKLGVLSLALSGIFSIILVISRTPQLIEMVPQLGELFGVSLVIHVDLSVLVWFLSMSAMLWAIWHHQSGCTSPPYFRGASGACVLVGMLLMALSPLSGEWETIKSNYVPVLVNGLFFTGLGLIAAGIVIAVLVMLPAVPRGQKSTPVSVGIYLSVWTTLFALMAFVASYYGIADSISGLAFYETLFWAGGHLLQFTYVQSMLVAWMVLAVALGLKLPASRFCYGLVMIGPVAACGGIAPYFFLPVSEQAHMDFFTWQMNIGLGIAGSLLGLWLAVQLARSSRIRSAIYSALVMSLLLYAVGGIFGALIDGPNVRIPAHYHGSIVAVTLAVMGLAYLFMPRMGYADVSNWRMARLQPYLYGFGQLLHISGLAWSGGYGVLRKTVGDTGDGSWQVKAALGMMGGGGLLAIIGGLCFVIVMAKAFSKRSV